MWYGFALPMTTSLASTLRSLQEEFLQLHTTKEDLFWSAKMGIADDPEAAQKALSAAEIGMNRFLQDPTALRRLRDLRATREGTPQQPVSYTHLTLPTNREV